MTLSEENVDNDKYDKSKNNIKSQLANYYTLEKCNDDKAFFPGRAMNIILHRNKQHVKIGSLGVIHPNSLKIYDMPFPCSYMEMNIQFLCK